MNQKHTRTFFLLLLNQRDCEVSCGISSSTLSLYPMNGIVCFKSLSRKFWPEMNISTLSVSLGLGILDYPDHFRAFILTKYTKDCTYDYDFLLLQDFFQIFFCKI